jgi:hypothetical protein
VSRCDVVVVGVLGLAVVGCGRIGFGDATDAGAHDASLSATGCTAPLTGHDEDGDGIDDACDPCPHVAGANDAAEIGQPVGSACDPQLTGAQRIEFASFAGAQLPAGWLVRTFAADQTPQWTVANDAASISLIGANVAALSRPTPACQQLMIETAVNITGLGDPGPPGKTQTQRNLGVIDKYNATDVGGLLVGPVRDAPGENSNYELAYLDSDNPPPGDITSKAPAFATLVTTFHLRYVRPSATGHYQLFTCTSASPEVCTAVIDLPREPMGSDFGIPDPLDLSGTEIGVRARGTSAAIEYVFIVGGDCS